MSSSSERDTIGGPVVVISPFCSLSPAEPQGYPSVSRQRCGSIGWLRWACIQVLIQTGRETGRRHSGFVFRGVKTMEGLLPLWRLPFSLIVGIQLPQVTPRLSCLGVWKTTRRHWVNSRRGSRPKVLAGSIFCSCVGRKEFLARVASVARYGSPFVVCWSVLRAATTSP